MGTRENPGAYDAYAVAMPSEPLFTLLARDPLAGFLVSIWSSARVADWEAADAKFRRMCQGPGVVYCLDPEIEKSGKALDIAMAMFAWRGENDGRWREPHPPFADPLVIALGAAVMALRSYQHGNGAPDLAASIADAGEKALRDAGFPAGFMANAS